MRYRISVEQRRRQQRRFRVAVIVLVLLICMVLVDMRVRPVVKTVAGHYGRLYAADVINQAVAREIEGNGQDYRNIVTLHRDNRLQVTSLEIDMVQVNKLKTRVTGEVLAALEKNQENTVHFPLGTMVGSELFAGWGPMVELKVAPAGYIDVEIENHFQQAGINQVLHQVTLKIDARVTAIVPGCSAEALVSTNFVIAETVIVGNVPEAFTSVEDTGSGLSSKIFDFGADKNNSLIKYGASKES